MKYYLDEDLSPKIAMILRNQGIDSISSHECNHNGWDDAQQLAWAASDNRCFVTRNRNDFIELTVQFFESISPHAGLLIVSLSLHAWDVSLLAGALAKYAQVYPDGMQAYTIDFLGK